MLRALIEVQIARAILDRAATGERDPGRVHDAVEVLDLVEVALDEVASR